MGTSIVLVLNNAVYTQNEMRNRDARDHKLMIGSGNKYSGEHLEPALTLMWQVGGANKSGGLRLTSMRVRLNSCDSSLRTSG
jgi:hypothetical protein